MICHGYGALRVEEELQPRRTIMAQYKSPLLRHSGIVRPISQTLEGAADGLADDGDAREEGGLVCEVSDFDSEGGELLGGRRRGWRRYA